jgi:aspartate 1-decarboxylase
MEVPMHIQVLKSKIHGAVITQADLHYEGSLTVDPLLMKKAKMFPNEKIQVVNVNNGSRIETYLIEGKKGSGVCCLNGPAARSGMPGDKVIIISYGLIDVNDVNNWEPTIVIPKKGNKI